MTDHTFSSDTDRCTCGGVVVYFENDGNGPDGEGCEVAGTPWVNAMTSGPEPDWAGILEELETLDDDLQQIAGRIGQVESALTPGAVRERLRQVRAQLEIAGGFGEAWVGGSSYTLSSSIDEIREWKAGHDDGFRALMSDPGWKSFKPTFALYELVHEGTVPA